MTAVVEGHGIRQRAVALAQHLPSQPFSRAGALDLATGVNLLGNAAQVDAILDVLVDTAVISSLGGNPETWVVNPTTEFDLLPRRCSTLGFDDPSPHADEAELQSRYGYDNEPV